MNVMNRKLFANRDARRKLANMGGIIASSPELLGTAQTFENGGRAFDSLYRGIIDTLDEENLSFTDRTDAPRYATNMQKRDRKRILDNNLGGHQSLYFPTGDDARSQAIADINRRALDFIKSDTYQSPSEIYGESVEPAVVKVKTVRIGDPLGGTNYDLYSDGSAVMLSTGRRIDPSNASAQPLLEMLQDLPDVSDTSDMSQPPVVEEPVLDSAPITEDERGILSKIVDFVKDDFSNFPKLPDSREAKDELVRGKLADQIRNEGIFSGSNVQDTPKDTEGFTTVTLNQGTTSMAVFDYNPETGEVIPRGTNAELMYSGSNKAQANVQNMIQEQYNLDSNVKPVLEAEKEADITQQIYESDPSGKNLELASEARKKELEVKKETTTKKPSEVDKVLSRTTPFVDPPSAMDEIEEEFLKRREKEKEERELAEFEKIRDSMDAVPEAGSKKEAESNQVISDLGKAVNKEANKKGGGSPANAGANVFLDAAGVDSSNMTLKEKVTSMKEIYTDLLGYDDEEESELFWLNMAQIGFLVASGQDPNALSNIASGFAQGASKFAEDKRDKKARDDKMTLAAFGEVMDDERARRKFGYDLALVKARGEAKDADDRSNYLYKSTFDKTYADFLENDPGNYAAAIEAARNAASEAAPGAGLASTIVSQAQTGSIQDEVNKQLGLNVPVETIRNQLKQAGLNPDSFKFTLS